MLEDLRPSWSQNSEVLPPTSTKSKVGDVGFFDFFLSHASFDITQVPLLGEVLLDH
jgi:hypothetical protein